MSDRRFEGRSALVTGAGTGIGAAVARRLVGEGCRVTIAGRRVEPLRTLADELPVGALAICPTDVTDPDAVAEAVGAAVEHGNGTLDLLVNNAGAGGAGSVTEVDHETWRSTLEVNLHGPFLVMREALPLLALDEGGSVVNVSSVAGLEAAPESAAYCVSKAGLVMLTKQAALDYGPRVRINAVCPGWVRTRMADAEMDELAAHLDTDRGGAYSRAVADVPMQRAADPEEIAAAVAFLGSDDASYMTGAVLPVDGGSTVVDVATTAFRSDGRPQVSPRR